MRRLTLIIGGGVALLGAAAATGAYVGLQYSERVEVIGEGQKRFRSERPVIRLLVRNPASLGQPQVVVDGHDVSSLATKDRRGIVLRGVAIRDGWHRVRIAARSSGIFGKRIDRRFSIVIDTHRPDARTRRHGRLPAAAPSRRARTEKGATVVVRWKGGHLTRKAPDGTFAIDPGLSDGRYAFRITARDPVGNVSRVRWQKVIVDSQPPDVDLSSVRGVVEQASTALTGSVTDASPTKLLATLDGAPIAFRAADGSQLRFAPRGTTSWTVPLENLAEGQHELRVTAEDAAPERGPDGAALHRRLDREAAAGRHADDRRPRQGRGAARAAPRERGPLEGEADALLQPPHRGRRQALPGEALDAADRASPGLP